MYAMNQDVFKNVIEYLDVMMVLYAIGCIDEKGNIII